MGTYNDTKVAEREARLGRAPAKRFEAMFLKKRVRHSEKREE